MQTTRSSLIACHWHLLDQDFRWLRNSDMHPCQLWVARPWNPLSVLYHMLHQATTSHSWQSLALLHASRIKAATSIDTHYSYASPMSSSTSPLTTTATGYLAPTSHFSSPSFGPSGPPYIPIRHPEFFPIEKKMRPHQAWLGLSASHVWTRNDKV